MTPSESGQVVLELERLRGTVETGFARADGHLALLVQRSDQSDKAIADHEKRLDAVERGETERQKRDTARLDALERGRWPLPSIAALAGLAGLGLSVYQLSAR